MGALDSHFTFAIAARAAGWSEIGLRNALTRGLISTTADKLQNGAWRRFNLLDILTLAVTARISRYGVEIKKAYVIARQALAGPFTEIRKHGNDVTGADIAQAFHEFEIHLHQGEIAGIEPAWNAGEAGTIDHSDYPDNLSVRVSAVLGDIIRRMQDMFDTGFMQNQLADFQDIAEELELA